ncbi:hypothetical protein GN109_05860 [Collimonas pratensis]|uniref:hypothetical protein n=1 Tax=Collimonas pratensis TaxID=279113 RepID=UPI00143D6764|nr:hypothetical protein [Collimonas pratensis]NKI68939.1 hypothetical protein [Collimonas pratensis]
MNVKQGDLAIQIRSDAGNEGHIWEVISFLGASPRIGIWRFGYGDLPTWFVRSTRPVMSDAGAMLTEGAIPDAWLRSVSGLPIEEETKQTEEA